MWDFTILVLPLHVTRLVTMMLTRDVPDHCLLSARQPARQDFVPNGCSSLARAFTASIRNGVAREVIGPEQGLKFAPYLTCLSVHPVPQPVRDPAAGADSGDGATSRFRSAAVISWAMFMDVGIKKQARVPISRRCASRADASQAPVCAAYTDRDLLPLIVRPFTLAVRLLMNMFAGPTSAPGVHDGHALTGHPSTTSRRSSRRSRSSWPSCSPLRAAGHRRSSPTSSRF